MEPHSATGDCTGSLYIREQLLGTVQRGTRPRPAVEAYPADEDCPYTPLNTPNIELLDGIEVLEYPRYYYQGPEPLWACAPGFEGPERIGAIIRMGFYAYYIMRLPSIRPGEAPTLGGGC